MRVGTPSPLQHGRRYRTRRKVHGAATLIVVMVLFFIVSLVAAYTSRNLLFEQRTSGNQLRSSQASEAAEAGLQWALTQLNGGRIDGTCAPSVNLANTSFRQRYLDIDPVSGNITPRTKPNGADLLPSCVFNGGNWNCSCPVDGDPAPAIPAGSDVFPAFRVRFRPVPARPTLVRIDVNSCTRYADACLAFPAQGADNEGRAAISTLVTLKGSITTPPIAAVTARGSINLVGAANLVATNQTRTPSITVHAGAAIDSSKLTLNPFAGIPAAQSIVAADPALQFNGYPPAADATLTRPEAMFVATFGMRSATYSQQQAAVVLNCAGACTADQVRTAAERNPLRVIWVNGNLNFDSGADVGSPTEPLTIVVTGQVTFTAPATVYGLVYSRADPWTFDGAGTIVGAAVGESSIDGTTTAMVTYDRVILDALRTRTGTFVMVPGAWRDF